MTETSPFTSNSDTSVPSESTNFDELLKSLRRKEHNWIYWGQACAQLQKAGYGPQKIFEETGFEPIQQNQVIVGAQVYNSLESEYSLSEPARSYFQERGSDILYEFRILTQPQRLAATEFVIALKLDSDEARQLAKAIKDFSRLASIPEGFTDTPGDAMAYQCWKSAREQAELQERSRLIARGLKFAQSVTAREKIQELLTDFTVVPQRKAPRLPVFRLESEEQLPRIVPIVGQMPMSVVDWKAVPFIEETGPFRLVKFAGQGAWVAVPGWQVILNAEDLVGVLSHTDRFSTPLGGLSEELLLLIDRSDREWNPDHYFISEVNEEIEFQWFDNPPTSPLLGKVVLILRPQKILDENSMKDTWAIDD